MFKNASNVDGSVIQIQTSLDAKTINSSVLQVANQAKDNDKPIVCVVPKEFLSNRSSKSVRKQIVLENLLETVIVVPSRWLNDANSDMAILFFNKRSRRPGNIKFIDITYESGNDYFPDGAATVNLIAFNDFPDFNNLIGDIEEEEMDLLQNYFSEFMCIAGNYKVNANDYSLDPALYIDRIPHIGGYSLCEIWNFKDQTVENVKGRIIHLSDLKNSPTDCELDVSSFAITEENGKFYSLHDRGVIVAKKGGELKPTLVDTKGLTVYVPCDDMCIIDNEQDDDLLFEYIVSELYKDYARWQCKAWQNGIVSYLRIRFPKAINGKSSIEIQQMDSVHSRYQVICDYCKREDLVELLWMLCDERVRTNKDVPKIIRDIIGGFILQKLLDLDIVRGKISSGKTNISEFSNALSGKEIDDSSVKPNKKNVPIYIQRIFHDFSDIVQDGAHPKKVQEHLSMGKAPFLNKMLIYELLTVLQWCFNEENKR